MCSIECLRNQLLELPQRYPINSLLCRLLYNTIIVIYCNTIILMYIIIDSADSGARIIIGSVTGAIALLVVLISALVIVCCLISHTKGKAKGN